MVRVEKVMLVAVVALAVGIPASRAIGPSNDGDYFTKPLPTPFPTPFSSPVSGIGAAIMEDAGVCRIMQVLPDSGAKAAGILPNDEILRVDGTSVAGFTIEDIASLLRGSPGTRVLVTVKRPGAEKPLDIWVVRAPIKVR
jgi:carboxyl-terminal processing protease